MASILKYDRIIPVTKDHRTQQGVVAEPCKGYYKSEDELVSQIKRAVGGTDEKRFKTIECSIMDVADDIAYSTYDIEDAFAAVFLNPISILSVSDREKTQIALRIQKKIDIEFSELDLNERSFSVDPMNEGLQSIFATVLEIPQTVFTQKWSAQSLGAAVGGDV